MAMKTLEHKDVKVKSYKIHLIEMVINAVYYNPVCSLQPCPAPLTDSLCQVLTLQNLESNGWTSKFFSLWFANVESFRRVHDKKLSICAIVALLELDPSQLPLSVQQGWPKLIQGVVRLFQTLPAAMKSKELLKICSMRCANSG